MRPSLRSLAIAALAVAFAFAPVLAASDARAADTVTVPDVDGLVWQDALQTLTSAGLVGKGAGDGVVVLNVSTVADQCPRAGDSVAPGSTVKLTVRTTIANCPAGGGSGGGGTGGSGAQAAAMWPLDEVTGTLANDATGNGHDGTYGSGVNLGGPGSPKNGNAAAVFDGGGVTVQYSPDLNPATYTVEAWVDPNSVNGYMDQGTAARSIACSRDAGHGYMLYADNYTGVPQFAFVVGAGSSLRYVYDATGVPEQPGQWYHVAGSFDGTDLHLYVNGVEVTGPQLNDGGGTDIEPMTDPSFPFQIGMCDGGSAQWDGAIQDVTFWDTALDAGTIAQHASGGTPPPGGGGSGGGGGCADCPGYKPTVPLVFFPGILGTSLNGCTGDINGINVWPDATFNPDLLPDLAFDPNGVGPCVGEILESYRGSDFYDKTFDALVRDGYVSGKTLFGCPYDWRLSVAVSAQNAFNGCIQTALAESGAPEVDVLAHSQGGLVASQLVAHSQGAVRRLVTVGTPVLGAEKTLDVLEWAHECTVGPTWFGFYCPASLDKKEAQHVLGTMPSSFELLPSPLYATAVRPPLVLPGKSSSAYSTLADYVAQRYDRSKLDAAVTLHGELDNFTPSVPMLRIVGTGQKTLVGVVVRKTRTCYRVVRGGCFDRTFTDFVESNAGDGTVPLHSADLKNGNFDHRDGVPNRYFSNSHMGLIQSDESIAAAVKFFRQPNVASPRAATKIGGASAAASVVLPDDMPGSDTPPAVPSSVQIEVLGGASSTVQSLSGGRLGDGLEGIDGGEYNHADGTDSFTLDAAGTYAATVQPTDPYPLLVLVRRYSDAVDQQSVFSVPAPVPGKAITLPLTTSQDLGTLRLNVNGTQVAPIATTNGDDVEDATPPTTVAGATVSSLTKATVTLAAQDDGGAGVAATYYEATGAAAPSLYTQPFRVPLFSSVSFWSVDKAGNTEDVHTIVADDTPDVRQLATPIAAGHSVLRTIWPAGDEDWFTFSADRSSLVTAQLDGLLTHFDLELYDAAGNLLQAPHSGPPWSEEIQRVLPAGTYYLHVTGQARLLLPYTLTLRMSRH